MADVEQSLEIKPEFDPTSPVDVTFIPGEKAEPAPGIALCLSGGGYRAMTFHLGALWRLNELGYLPKLNRVSSVSGGSITAGVLGVAWGRLAFNLDGVAQYFQEEVADPIRRMARRTIDWQAVVRGLLMGSPAGSLARAYDQHLFHGATLQDLPDDATGPRFVINASNVQSGALWRFMRPYMRDYRVGEVRNPRILLAEAVAASSAFPPILSPLILTLDLTLYTPGSGTDLFREPFTTRVMLTDGGVYDNLGLETAWKRYRTILVSDAGGKTGPEAMPKTDWVRHALRLFALIDNQVRSLRKRQVINGFKLPPSGPAWRNGTYWGIRTNIVDYKLADPLDCPHEKTMQLAAVATRLAALDPTTMERLINWGYAVCDAAMRKHVVPTATRPTSFPYPRAGVG